MFDREAISRARQDFVDAFNSEDDEALAAILTDDHVKMPPNQPPLRGRAASRSFWRKGWAQAASRFTATPGQLKITSDVAIDEFYWTMESLPRDGGSPVRDEGRSVWLWRRQPDGSWKLARAIWNSDLADPGLWTGGNKELAAVENELVPTGSDGRHQT